MSNPAKILVIDDEATIRQSFADYLEDLGYLALTAANGRIGLKMLAHEQPDLVLTDLRMPEVDGMEVIRHGSQLAPDTPIIVISGTGRIDEAIQALRLGAWDYILKPDEDLSMLEHRVKEALEKTRLIRENRMYQENLERMVRERTTELEATNVALRKSEASLKVAQQVARLGNWTWDFKEERVYWSAEMYNIYGFKKGTVPDIEKVRRRIVPADRPIFDNALQSMEKGDVYESIEYRIKTTKGQLRYLVARANAVFDDSGAMTGLVGTLQDITQQKENENNLNEAQRIAKTGHWIWNPQNGDLFWSDELFRIFGEARTFKPSYDSFIASLHPDDKALVVQAINDALADIKPYTVDVRIISKSGETKNTLIQGEVTFGKSKKPVLMRGTVSDITERKKAEQMIKDSEERLKILFESAPAAYYLHDLKGNIIDGNKAAEALMGYQREELIGKHFAKLNLISLKELPRAAKNLAKNALGQSTVPEEFNLTRKDGSTVPVEIRAHPVKMKGKTVVLGIARDITERKQAEKSVQQRNSELEFLNRIGQTLVSTLDLERMLVDVMEDIRQLLDVFGCSVWLLDTATTDELVCLQATASHNEVMLGWKLAPEQGLVSWAVHHDQSILAADTRTDPRHYPEIDRRIGVEMRSIISVPLRVKQEIIGGLNVVDTAVNRFSPADLSLVESLAATMAIATENARLFDREQHQRQAAEQALRETRLLFRISSILVQTSDMQAAIEQVLGEYLRALNLNQGGISLFDPEEQWGKLYALYRDGHPQPTELPIKIVSRVYQKLIESKQPVAIVDAWNDPLLADNRELTALHQIKSILFVPLLVQGQVVGVLGADSTDKPRRFSNREIKLGQTVADQVAGAVDRIRLDEEQRRLTAVLEQATATIVITDLAGNIVYANPYFEISSGYSVVEALGQNPNIVESGQHGPSFYQELWDTISSGDTWHGTFINKRKDGTLYHEEASVFPIKSATGEIINYAAVKRDITERVRTEEQLRQSQRLEAVGRLAGGVAHDFNNLLTVITGHIEFLLMLHPDANDPLRRDIFPIKRAAERAAALTHQLLAFSRRQVLQPQRLNLNKLVVDLEKMLGRLIREDIELITRLTPQLEPIYADPGQIEQVITNLVVNARDAMPDGGTLTIETAGVYLETPAALHNDDFEAGPHIRLTVSDTGLGIDTATWERIFEPFFTTKPEDQGTGLGLATVHGIITQSKGCLEVESKLGQGTSFKVYLPQATSQIPVAKQEQSSEKIEPGAEIILLVEDEDGVRNVIYKALSGYGYTVLVAANGEEARRISDEHQGPIHLLLTDVVMPGGVGGAELAQTLSARRPEMNIAFMSGYAEETALQQSKIDVGHFLQKPFSPVDLVITVQAALASDLPSTREG